MKNILIAILLALLLCSCSSPISRLKKEQFNILKQNVVQLLGEEYKVKKINIQNEGYSDDQNQYIVDFIFDLNKPHVLLPTSNLPGKLIFAKGEDGKWTCILNTGNPAGLFKLSE